MKALQQKRSQDEAWEQEAWERREGGSLSIDSAHSCAPLMAVHSTQYLADSCGLPGRISQ